VKITKVKRENLVGEDFTFGLDLGFRVLIAVLGAA
jgi:hypothetical protein